MAEKEYDVLIVGSGASGGMAAYTLTQKGAKCLLLDAGPAVDFNRQRTLKPVSELPYRGFGSPTTSPAGSGQLKLARPIDCTIEDCG